MIGYCPIIEYKLCKEGKKIYKKLMNLCSNNYKNLTKICLENNEYELLLKAIPFHMRMEYENSFKINGKLIIRNYKRKLGECYDI